MEPASVNREGLFLFLCACETTPEAACRMALLTALELQYTSRVTPLIGAGPEARPGHKRSNGMEMTSTSTVQT